MFLNYCSDSIVFAELIKGKTCSLPHTRICDSCHACSLVSQLYMCNMHLDVRWGDGINVDSPASCPQARMTCSMGDNLNPKVTCLFGTEGVFFLWQETFKALGVEYTNVFNSMHQKGLLKGVVSNCGLGSPQNSTL